MASMKLTPLFCLSLGIFSATMRAQVPISPDEHAVWEMEAAWNKAYVDGDAAKLAELESKNYVFTEEDGMVHTRADELADAQGGDMHFTEMSLHEATVRITGDTAIVTGRIVEAGGQQEKFGEINEATDTLVRENGAWRAVASSEIHLAATAQSALAPLWRDGGGWLKRHDEFVAQAKKGGVDLLFVGDSITDFWRTRGKAVWDKYYGNLHAANIGISGDRTQHVLWRLDHGEVDGLRPKVVVLMIGTNNTGLERDGLTPRNTPAEAAAGVKAVVNDLRQKFPNSKILLLAVFPRSHAPGDPARLQVAEINQVIAGLDDGDHVRYLDIGAKFLTADGMLEKDIMPDYLHPTPKGYEIWAQAIQTSVAQMLHSGG
jgi:lysophospholipase L1-like esterase